MSDQELSRVPNPSLPSKSSVAIYRFPGGGGLFWAVATAADTTEDFAGQTRQTLAALDERLKAAGVGRDRIVRTEVIVTDHDNKPTFDAIWSKWAVDGHGPVRSFVQSVMPKGDLIEIIVTAALPAES